MTIDLYFSYHRFKINNWQTVYNMGLNLLSNHELGGANATFSRST